MEGGKRKSEGRQEGQRRPEEVERKLHVLPSREFCFLQILSYKYLKEIHT